MFQDSQIFMELPNFPGVYAGGPGTSFGQAHSPFARAGALKACSMCGATKTPQWREGPDGPKTLCNACGVKRTRQKGPNEGGKRRNVSHGPKTVGRKKTTTEIAHFAGPSHSDRSDGERVCVGATSRGDMEFNKRPQRKAAVKAQARNNAFASTGDFPDEDDAFSSPVTGHTHRAMSVDSAGGSDSADGEMGWIDWPAPPQGVPPSPSPMVCAVGLECAAAVNLLSMSVGDPFAPRKAEPVHTGRSSRQRGASRALDDDYLPSKREVETLPESDLRGMYTQLRENQNCFMHQAALAETAVAAVAEILASKQAAAIAARQRAASANLRLRNFEAGVKRALAHEDRPVTEKRQKQES